MSAKLNRIYARFEDRFRGSRDDILTRLEVYEPLLDLVEDAGPSRSAVDYGCGRGEWLQLLASRGWDARGVDTNTEMLAVATQHGLHVERADAIAHLSGLPDASVDVLSAFHLAEHLPMDLLLDFISEAMRVVRFTGVVIIETPNAENLLVSSTNFYLDPTHERPLPPLLLQFFVEDGGATVAEVVRLNGEATTGAEPGSIAAALRPMFMTGLDYAVVACRSTDASFQDAIRAFARSASQAAPVDLSTLAAVDERTVRHEKAVQTLRERDASDEEAIGTLQRSAGAMTAQLEQGIAGLVERHDRLEAANDRLHAELQSLARRMTDLVCEINVREQLEDANVRLSNLASETTAREAELEAQLQATRHNLQQTSQVLADKLLRESQLSQQVADMYASTSWRLTRPVRMLSDLMRSMRGRPTALNSSTVAETPSSVSVKRRRDGLMIDPDPSALAAWEALFAGSSARESRS